MTPFKEAKFLLSVQHIDQLPKGKNDRGELFPEIAVVGRSNVGKSSLINHLLKTKQLAKTSATPGKTQTLNFYLVDSSLLLADLPGYGYAKISRNLRATWGPLIEEYLEARSPLRLILLLLDIRHPPSRDDLAFLEWARDHKKPTLIVFTKSDKVSESEKRMLMKNALTLLGEEVECMSFSIKELKARTELVARINQHL